MRGWLVWISPEKYLKFIGLIRPYDVVLSIFTLVVEFGALVGFLIGRRSARLWFGMCLLLHTGIYALSGVFFWKWMLVNIAFMWWFGQRGQATLKKIYEYKLPLILTGLAICFSANRIWYYPQTHVVWYDTQLLYQYDIVVVGKSGEKYVVDPNYFAPQDLHMAQGPFCYATDNERALTHTYGTTGSYEVMKQLNQFTDPKQALQLHSRGAVCIATKSEPPILFIAGAAGVDFDSLRSAMDEVGARRGEILQQSRFEGRPTGRQRPRSRAWRI